MKSKFVLALLLALTIAAQGCIVYHHEHEYDRDRGYRHYDDDRDYRDRDYRYRGEYYDEDRKSGDSEKQVAKDKNNGDSGKIDRAKDQDRDNERAER